MPQQQLRLDARMLMVFVVVCGWLGSPARGQNPNILWITAEDMSPTLGCYGDSFATTPNIDRLATQSSRYTHAFATAPVCSPSRACLINGVAAPTQGTHAMRSLFPLPEEMSGFPSRLRRIGYYTTNNVKTDYNSAAEPRIIAASWDDNSDTAHWRGREGDQPFFSIFNLMTSHQSRTMVWPQEQFQQEVQSRLAADEIHDPAKVPLPPYYPDTPLVRKTVARYYDCVAVMDQQVGEILDQLAEDGLDDDTIVFFYSDHGSGMPRHKRALFDSGMRVPLLIRFPEKYRDLAPCPAGDAVDRLVCFEDFAPTIYSLVGFDLLPRFMRGKAFLGPLDSVPHRFLFGHRDRVDEIVDMARSVRSKDFLYIRNFMPHLGYNQQSAWIDQGEVRNDFYKLAASGQATPAQNQYLSATRPVEELYDCVADPLNLVNLAEQPKYRGELKKMRKALRGHLIASRDLGLVPEIDLWHRSRSTGSTPMEWAASDAFDPARLLQAAELVGSDDFQAIESALSSEDAAIRYWGAISSHSSDELTKNMTLRLRHSLSDESAAVRIEAAAVMARRHGDREALMTLVELLRHSDQTVVLHAARALELIADPTTRPAIQALADRFEDEPGDMAWFIRFTTSGYLSRVQ